MVKMNRVKVTPQKAQVWLETCNRNNRKINKKYVTCLARDIANGKWLQTHDGIAFDTNGDLLDGQHRLSAIIEADTPVDMLVYRDVDPCAAIVIDQGKCRTMFDTLTITGKNGKVTNDHVMTLKAMLGGFSTFEPLTSQEISDALRTHRDAINFAIRNIPKSVYTKGISTPVTWGVIARAYYNVHTEKLKTFCKKLVTGAVTEDETYITKLCRALQNQKDKKIPREIRYAKMERVLAAWLKREKIKGIHPAKFEQFPLPEEVCYDSTRSHS